MNESYLVDSASSILDKWVNDSYGSDYYPASAINVLSDGGIQFKQFTQASGIRKVASYFHNSSYQKPDSVMDRKPYSVTLRGGLGFTQDGEAYFGMSTPRAGSFQYFVAIAQRWHAPLALGQTDLQLVFGRWSYNYTSPTIYVTAFEGISSTDWNSGSTIPILNDVSLSATVTVRGTLAGIYLSAIINGKTFTLSSYYGVYKNDYARYLLTLGWKPWIAVVGDDSGTSDIGIWGVNY